MPQRLSAQARKEAAARRQRVTGFVRLNGPSTAPLDSSSTDIIDSTEAGVGERTRRFSTGQSDVNWQLRLEMKL